MELKAKESAKLHKSTIEIQDHLLYCLQNTGVHLLPAMAKMGSSSIQNEKILLLKELLLHSKSYVEEPVIASTSAAEKGQRRLELGVNALLRQAEQSGSFEDSYESYIDEDEDEDMEYDDEDIEEELESEADHHQSDERERERNSEGNGGDNNQEQDVMAFIQEPVIELEEGGAATSSQEESAARIVLVSNAGVSYREITEAELRIEQEENSAEGNQQLDPQP